ncbi:Leucine-rich repeat-containing protein 16B [Acipenser ruthenus]|uniref:Leucine-rich repeat-containing protein 16B n=1 Tax=Acipenser ruthenus TaxID=7906 RepID=A0A444UEH2_ACIRT|nr:Leucine-rich repeat-containing protein 16B [Acipenser ruthenus]
MAVNPKPAISYSLQGDDIMEGTRTAAWPTCQGIQYLSSSTLQDSFDCTVITPGDVGYSSEWIVGKVKGIPAAVKEFFSSCASLKFLGLSASKLPSEVLRSAGAQVIQDHIFEANAIGSLDLSDNGFDSDMVTLVLSIGRSQSIRHLSLGKNFCMKSKALADVLCRIVQLIQEEECPLESLSVADSKLKAAGTTILINALGSNPSLSKIDISGNCMGDTGAKMLAKALQINTKLRTVIWDRNNTTAIGFLDVANALEKNYTLKSLAMPVSDVAQASRSNPEKTEEALQKIQSSLLRNNQRYSAFSDRASRLQQGIITSSSEQLVSCLCTKLQGSMASLSSCSAREVQEDIVTAEEVLREARASINLLPTLYQMGRAPSSVDVLHYRLKETAEEITQEISQEIQAQHVLEHTKTLPQIVTPKTEEKPLRKNKALFELAEMEFPTDEHGLARPLEALLCFLGAWLMFVRFLCQYVPVIRRHTLHARSIRPAPSMKSLVELDSESQQEDSEAGASQAGLSISSKALVKSRPASTEDAAAAAALSNSLVELDSESQQEDSEAGASQAGLSISSKALVKSRPASTEDAAAAAALSNSLPPSSEPASPQPLMDLPIEGQRLKHYTRARPRPNRRNKQPPSKPNVQAVACENEDNIGNVDEGVEEFFTKKLLPEDPLKSQQPAKAREPTCSASPPSSSKTIKKKFGDFFAFKKPRSARGAKGEGGPESSPSVGLRLKKTSIADLIRPLREAARAAERADESAGKAAAAASVTVSAGSSVTDSPAAQPPGPVDRERSKTLDSDREKSKTPDADRKLKPSRRSLREGKSQSLILLPGVNEDENLPGNHGKKHFSDKAAAEGAQTFEQKVHVMLHRIGVTKVLSSDPKKNENKEGELRKADSEGTIVDSKPQPPPQFMKPRTMSTSSDIRRPGRPSIAAEAPEADSTSTAKKSSREHASPAFHKIVGKPPVPDHKDKSSESLSSPRTPVACPEQAHPESSTAGAAQEADSLSRCKKDTPTPSPRRGTSLGEQKKTTEPAMPTPSEDNLPVPRPRIKPIHNRRAVSVHEEQLRDQSSLLEPEGLVELDSESQQEDSEAGASQAGLSISSKALVKSRPASTEDAAAAAALSNSLPPSSEPASPQPLMDLPIEGQRLKHYTRARPRPNRRNKQPPSKPNVQAVACENEDNIGNVDEGVEEFFTKKLLPEDPLKSQQPAKAREPTCSASPPSSSKTIKKKFGDFFAFKKPRSARGAKGEGGPESSPSVGLRLKKTSIADLIRPLREAARAAERADESAGKAAAAASVTVSAGSSVTDSPAAQPPGPVDRERSKTLDSDREKSKTPDADRKLKPSRRSLREGKSQSLILLPGVNEDENLPGNHGKKHFSDKAAAEGAQTFEQKVHVMLHRIGVTKVLSSDPKKNENKEGELRKADSEGTIVDSKPQPPPQFMKPRTMSTSSDIRRPGRPSIAAEAPEADSTSTAKKSSREHASPAFHKIVGKPPVPDHKDKSSESLSSPRTPVACPEQAHPESSTAGAAQEADSLSRCKKDTPTPSPRRGTSLGEQKKTTEPAMPTPSEDNLPVPQPRIKPIHNRRAVSVHEEQLRDQSSLLEPEGDRKTDETRTRPATREKRAGLLYWGDHNRHVHRHNSVPNQEALCSWRCPLDGIQI